MPTPDERVAELLAMCDAPDACVADLLCDRHPADAVAFTVVEPDLSGRDLTIAEIKDQSARFAAALRRLGVGPGDRVATLMGKSADLVSVLLGIWRAGAVHVPLFTAFAPPAIALRLMASDTKVVVTDPGQRSKLDPSEAIPADALWRVVVAGNAVTSGAPGAASGDLDLTALLAAEQPAFEPVAVGGGAPIVQLYTSGTTGSPKGVLVPVKALAAFQIYMEYGLDVRADDVFWNVADPGWAYGLYYGILGPLMAERRNLLLHASFSPELTWGVIQRYGVTNLAAAPTVYRALRAGEATVPSGLRLRVASSAGEPLNPEVIGWAERVLGTPIRDHYGQTELGMAIVNCWHSDALAPLKPGSMGDALPGWAAEVLLDDADEPAPRGTPGRVAIDLAGSPTMWFSEYHNAPDKTAERFSRDGRWYFTGDAGSRDEDGHFFFSSRDDDVIIMAGYRIGPFEVESVLVEHPDVVEAAVVGVPDELRGEVIEAYVVLRDGGLGSDELDEELKQLVKQRYAAHAYPRRVHFLPALPKTPSGKIQRYVLRKERQPEQAPPTE